MGKKKKPGSKKHPVEKVLLATVFIESRKALFELLGKLTE